VLWFTRRPALIACANSNTRPMTISFCQILALARGPTRHEGTASPIPPSATLVQLVVS
jgi:hypothetical protein